MSEFRSITLGFIEDEDRLAIELVAPDESVTLFFTRRLTRRLIRALAGLLAQSSTVMARAPVDMKKEVLVFEHQSARQAPADAPPPAAGADTADVGPAVARRRRQGLLEKLDIDTHPQHFALALQAQGGISVSLAMNRAEMHRLLASLHEAARLAEWNLEGEAGWLVDAAPPVATAS